MLIDYGSFAYCFYLLLPFAITVALYFVLRRRSMRTKKILIFCLLIANFIQHVLKTYIYPQYDGGFSYNQTAYNMCAFLILVSPFIFLCKNDFLKDAIFFFGTAAGIAAGCPPLVHRKNGFRLGSLSLLHLPRSSAHRFSSPRPSRRSQNKLQKFLETALFLLHCGNRNIAERFLLHHNRLRRILLYRGKLIRSSV